MKFKLVENLEKKFNLGEAFEYKDTIKIRVYIESTIEEALPTGRIEDIYDEQTLEEWFDFASTIEGIIERHGYTVDTHLSKNPESISEYIDFYTINSKGEKQPGLIDLRLSNHKQTANARIIRKKHAGKLDPDYQLKSVTVNERTFGSYDEAIQYIRNMFNMRYEESLEEEFNLTDIDNPDLRERYSHIWELEHYCNLHYNWNTKSDAAIYRIWQKFLPQILDGREYEFVHEDEIKKKKEDQKMKPNNFTIEETDDGMVIIKDHNKIIDSFSDIEAAEEAGYAI